MCFRPATAAGAPIYCRECGKRINKVNDKLPKKCPFCKASTEGLEEEAEANAAAAGMSQAPGAPGAPASPSAPGAPRPPQAPGAPKPPTA